MSDPSASIDDLLQHEEETPSQGQGPVGGFGGWVRTVLAACALTTVTVVGLRLFGLALSIPAILAGFLALLILRRVTARVAPPPPPRRNSYRNREEDGTYRWGQRDALRSAVLRWEKAFDRAERDRDWFNTDVLPMLGELADERLRQRHGLTRASDPGRARALMGEPLWKFLTTPVRRTPPPRDVAAIVALLEKL